MEIRAHSPGSYAQPAELSGPQNRGLITISLVQMKNVDTRAVSVVENLDFSKFSGVICSEFRRTDRINFFHVIIVSFILFSLVLI